MIIKMLTNHEICIVRTIEANNELVSALQVIREELAFMHAKHGLQYHQALKLLAHALTKGTTQ